MPYAALKEERRRQGITQEEMARVLGFQTRNAYALKERGLRKFYIEESMRIAEVLHMPMERLFFRSEG